MPDTLKVPTAEAMTVLLFAGLFTKRLSTSVRQLPAPFRNKRSFPHDRILAEVVGFYYFALLKNVWQDTGETDWDDTPDTSTRDPYTDSLMQSLDLCSTLIHSMADCKVPEMFVRNRAHAYSVLTNIGKRSAVDSLTASISDICSQDDTERVNLDMSFLALHVQAGIVSLPPDEIAAACRELYDEMAQHPDAF